MRRVPSGAAACASSTCSTCGASLGVPLSTGGKARKQARWCGQAKTGGGGLISYGIDLADLYRRAAGYVDLILKGAKPGDMPVQLPTKFEFVVNLKTARALGLTIPEPFLQAVVLAAPLLARLSVLQADPGVAISGE